MKPEDRQIIETRYAGSVYQEELENNLVDFLQHFEDHLPMYCNPRFLRHLLDDIETIQGDPLFPKSSSSLAQWCDRHTTLHSKIETIEQFSFFFFI